MEDVPCNAQIASEFLHRVRGLCADYMIKITEHKGKSMLKSKQEGTVSNSPSAHRAFTRI